MIDFVKRYLSRIEKHLNLLIRLLLQEQKQSNEVRGSPLFAHDGLFQYSDYHTVSNPKTFLLFTKIYHNVLIQLLNSFGN